MMDSPTAIATALKSNLTITAPSAGISLAILIGWLEAGIGITIGILTITLLIINIRKALKK